MGINVQNFAVANLRRRPVVVEVGGFVAGFDPETTSPYINYATPLPGAEPSGRDVAALIAAFRERGLKPRLEFAMHVFDPSVGQARPRAPAGLKADARIE